MFNLVYISMNQQLLYLNYFPFQIPKKSESFKVTERVQGVVEKVLDIYRTAPFGIISSATNLLIIVSIFHILWEMDLYIKLLAEVPSLGCAILSYKDIKGQFKLRKRLEKIIKKKGYNERIFLHTVNERCNVQTAKVVTKKYWCLDKYEKLSEQYKHRRTL